MRDNGDEKARFVLLVLVEPELATADGLDYVTVEVMFDALYLDESHGREVLDRILNPA